LDSRRGGGDYSSASVAGFSCTTGRLAPPPILLMLAIGSPSHSVSAAELRNSRTSLHTLQRPLLVAPWGLSITQWCRHVGTSGSATASGAKGSITMGCPPPRSNTHPPYCLYT